MSVLETSWNCVVSPVYTVGTGSFIVVVVVVVTCAAATNAVAVDVVVTVTGVPRQEHALISASAAKRRQMEGRLSSEVPRICILATEEDAVRPWRPSEGLSARGSAGARSIEGNFCPDMSSLAASRTSLRAVGWQRS